MIGWKLAVPAAMAVLGGGAMVAAASTDAEPTRPAVAQVWIDGPSGVTPLAAGVIPVTAHATAGGDIRELVLHVDGEEVAVDEELARNEKLVLGEFRWDADPGVHELVVEQRGATTVRSAARTVVVAGAGGPVPAASTATTTVAVPTSTPVADETTSTTTGPTTTTTTAPDEPPATVAPPEIDDTVPATTAAPPPTTTTAPAPSPIIASASISSTNQNRLYIGACGYTLTVDARVAAAERVQVQVEGTGFDRAMSRSGSSWSLTIGSGPTVWSAADLGSHRVIVVARGAGGEVRRVAGSLTVIDRCPKD
jgi:hypothetical protein